MPIKIDHIDSGFLYDASTGKRIMNVSDAGFDPAMETVESPDLSFQDRSITLTAEVNTDAFNQFNFLAVDDFPAEYDIEYTKMIQARKHRKYRTNKKWLKRYGYKQVLVKTTGWILHCQTDGTVEFRKYL